MYDLIRLVNQFPEVGDDQQPRTIEESNEVRSTWRDMYYNSVSVSAKTETRIKCLNTSFESIKEQHVFLTGYLRNFKFISNER